MSEGGHSGPSDERSAVVRDSIDGPGVVVRDEQRAVGHLVQVRGAAPRLVVLQPSRGEALLLGGLAHGQRDRCHAVPELLGDRKSTRLNSSHVRISYAVFCLKKKNIIAGLKSLST